MLSVYSPLSALDITYYIIMCRGIPAANNIIIKGRRRLVDHKHVYFSLIVVTVVAIVAQLSVPS